MRLRFGNVTLPEDLSRGQYRELKADHTKINQFSRFSS